MYESCYKDSLDREERILLTESDMERIRKLGLKMEFYQKNGMSNGPYEYEMVKEEGCIVQKRLLDLNTGERKI